MVAPNLSVTVEPSEEGSVVYLPLAARTSADEPNAQLSLVLTIKNNEATTVHVNDVTLAFAGPPAIGNVSIPVDVTLNANQTKLWYFATANNVILPLPAPGSFTVILACDGFSEPATVPNTMAAYTSSLPEGGYLFPGHVSDLAGGEFWAGQSAVHAPAGGGVQLFAYDMDVVGYDPTSDQLSVLAPGGSWNKNEDYRIWGKHILAVADGTVHSWADDQPTNPNPPADLSPPGPVEGNHFYIQHGSDLILYAHLQPGSLNPMLLEPKKPVAAGEFLGLAGNSGNSSRPHLHLHAIRGTQPWQGPPRPIPFRDINVIDRSVLNPPDPSGPWVVVNGQGFPSVPAAIWPSATKPISLWIPWVHALAIDPLALILRPDIYVKLTLPDPPPIDLFLRQVREVIEAMSIEDRRLALGRVELYQKQLAALEREIREVSS